MRSFDVVLSGNTSPANLWKLDQALLNHQAFVEELRLCWSVDGVNVERLSSCFVSFRGNDQLAVVLARDLLGGCVGG